jgi:integrase
MKRNWITGNPVRDIRSPEVSLKPTMPFTQEEMIRILAAVDTYRHGTPKNGHENACRLRAFVLILRYTGMRIGDVVNFSAERLNGDRLFLYTQKTGVPVAVVVPEFVIRSLASTPRKTANSFFGVALEIWRAP